MKFPLASVQALTRELSDHTPLLLFAGKQNHRGNLKTFRFELSWFLKDGFFDRVTAVWQSENRGTTPLQRWQNKIRRVRNFLKGWARNMASHNKGKKFSLLAELDILDRKAEILVLSPQESEYRGTLKHELTKILREEELYWLQQSKASKLLQADDNTTYFQLLANGRHRKTQILQLEQEEGIVVGHENI